MQIQRFGHPSYTDRIASKQIGRQKSGLSGNITDFPDYTTAGRTQKAEYYWRKMGLRGTYTDAVEMGKMQKNANKWQSIMELISSGVQFVRRCLKK